MSAAADTAANAAGRTVSRRSAGAWMEEARRRGLFRVGLPAPWGDGGGYAAIAATARALTLEAGDPTVGMAFAVRQLICRSFIAAHGSPAQKERWLPALASGDIIAVSLAVSEPDAGARPKLLKTRATKAQGGWRVSGRKAWVTNAPVAGLIVVIAIIGEEDGRKRFGAFLTPGDAPGLDIQAGADAGQHGRHCPVVLDDVFLPDDALLPVEGDAFAALALPFRTLEDSVGLSVQAAAFERLLRLVARAAPDDANGEIGALAGFAALMRQGAAVAAQALDVAAGRDGHDIATVVGVKNLLELALPRLEALPGGGAAGEEAQGLLKWFALWAGVARHARAAYQERLAAGVRAGD
ncbi:acyl-CoA dehydrogenase family protein [Camelimonas abortus]|uniref:Acyl-CoA dehydrogenase family protein n=1 Tax=Camelimonas abortus TaxID=1017184 RepID=A0ABV7LCJ0_9HYPH